MRTVKRVAAIHDLSCFGRCSLAVVMPVLSAMGCQCCPAPTAVLSTHTGGFGAVARTDLTGQLSDTLRRWKELGLTFDGVYTGYLAGEEQAELAAEALSTLKGRDGVAVVDPVLGDGGTLYRSMTPGMVRAMGRLCAQADVITPNLTEAALLLDLETARLPGGETTALLLSDGGRRSVVVTGVAPAPGQVGAAYYDRETGRTGTVTGERVAGEWPGTGDLFAAAVTGGLVNGDGLEKSVERAVEFVRLCALRTQAAGTPAREGVEFEPLLSYLSRELSQG